MGLEHMMQEKMLRAGFVQPEAKVQGGLTAVCNCLLGGHRRDRTTFFSDVHRARTRGNGTSCSTENSN